MTTKRFFVAQPAFSQKLRTNTLTTDRNFATEEEALEAAREELRKVENNGQCRAIYEFIAMVEPCVPPLKTTIVRDRR